MEDALILFETAKLAKEKGFNYKVTNHFRDGANYNKELINAGSAYNMNSSEEQELWNTNLYSAPTQSLLQKWLREVHKIKILVTHSPSGMYNFEIYKWNFDNAKGIWERIGHITHYETYEQAFEEGLKEALTLIEIK
jgi:hypothetical protein